MRFILILLGALMLASPALAGEMVMIASWYDKGARTADGTRFNANDPTIAAHRTLRLGTRLRVTNPKNGRWQEMIVRDRGPYTKCDLDVSLAAAERLGFVRKGHARLIITIES